MTVDTSLTKAAQNIIDKSLGLRVHQNLLIFTDAGSLDAANLVAETSRRNGVQATILFVPYSFQSRFDRYESLPLPIEAAIRETDAVVNFLTGAAETMAYRQRVLRTSWGRRVKVAHCPGMTLDILRMADVDYGLIRQRCQLLATALVMGKQGEIKTADSQGNEHCLEVEIGGWEFTPGIGDGVIPDGAWANLPPGETFTLPLSGRGSIIINGSIPGRVLQPGEELLLSFRDGRLIQMQPEDSPAARHLQKTQIDFAKSQADPNWSNLAEVGIGVNPVIRQLTGIPLVDEKKAGTIHIALGDSDSLGGKVGSTIHCDLVAEQPTLRVDGRLLLDKGCWRADESAWLPDYQTAAPPADWWRGIKAIRRSGVRTERLGDLLVRYWNAGPGRWDHTFVGTEQTARLAALLYAALPEQRETISRDRFLETAVQANLSEDAAASLLWILNRYDLVRLSGE